MKKLAILVVALYSAAFGAMVIFQDALIYPFDPAPATPDARMIEHTLVTPDQARLKIWAASPERGKPTILYFHGNAGNLDDRAQRFDRILDRGYGILALAYRGSTGSTGKPSQTKLRADSTLMYLQREAVIGPSSRIIYYGESLGTTVAIHLAAQHPPDGLILEAPFTSLTTLASEAMPYFPIRLGLRDSWDSRALMPNITSPLLVMHGTADAVVPFAHGTAIFDAAASKPKTFRKVDGLGHGGHWSVEGQKAIYGFIDGL